MHHFHIVTGFWWAGMARLFRYPMLAIWWRVTAAMRKLDNMKLQMQFDKTPDISSMITCPVFRSVKYERVSTSTAFSVKEGEQSRLCFETGSKWAAVLLGSHWTRILAAWRVNHSGYCNMRYHVYRLPITMRILDTSATILKMYFSVLPKL